MGINGKQIPALDEWEPETIEEEAGGVFDPRMVAAVNGLLEAIGEDPTRQGLVKTPARVARMFAELTAGYQMEVATIVNGAVFDSPADEMVLVRDIAFYSLCEHHLLPFYGRVHVAYLPAGRVIGLSKVSRIVELYARRLQIQEQMTTQIAQLMEDILQPRGVAVLVEGAHLCMMMRGVRQAQARMKTAAWLGEFKQDRALRMELYAMLGRGRARKG